jgi:hypothetical protein
MNPKYSRVADRLRQLINEGEEVAKLERPSSVGPFIQDQVPLHAWLVKVDNVLRTVFRENSAHFTHFQKLTEANFEHSYEVNRIIGVLKGGLSDLEAGFLFHQETLITSVVLDSVLEQACDLLKAGFKDVAAVLGRVALENSLRRIADEENVTASAKAASINDLLRDKGRYTKPRWRLVQSWLDLGNAAAHGQFGDYKEADVIEMIGGIERFVAEELR